MLSQGLRLRLGILLLALCSAVPMFAKSGGTVTFDLGASAHDTIELRDGSVLTGDLVSISNMDVELRIGGALQHISRNQVKRVLLVQREAPKQDNLPNATQ